MNAVPRTIAVTGASGFIGSALVNTLLAEGVAVRALIGPPGAELKAPPPQAATTLLDITDLDAVRAALDGVDAVVHLAGPPSVADSLQRPLEHARCHVMGTVTVLQACQDVGVRRLVYVSSAEVYGQPGSDAPVAEDHALAPRSPYAACKASAEHFVGAWAASHDFHAVVLRPFSIYGPGMGPASLIGSLLRQLAQGGAVSVHDLRPVRDYCHLDDLLRAIVMACAIETAAPLTFNIGSGIGVSVRTLINTLLVAAGREVPVVERVADRRRAGSEILALVADVRRARDVLGWTPRISLYDGLQRLAHDVSRAPTLQSAGAS